MDIWLLKRNDHAGYDEYDSFVVAASTATIARVMAGQAARDEGNIWVDHTRVTCERIGREYPHGAGVILGSFNAG